MTEELENKESHVWWICTKKNYKTVSGEYDKWSNNTKDRELECYFITSPNHFGSCKPHLPCCFHFLRGPTSGKVTRGAGGWTALLRFAPASKLTLQDQRLHIPEAEPAGHASAG